MTASNTSPHLIDPLQALRDYQQGRCAVCDENRARLFVDHDHGTGLVRGLLCNGCNSSEGRDFRAPWFREYRANPPARCVGLEVQYGQHQPRRPRPEDDAAGIAAVAQWMNRNNATDVPDVDTVEAIARGGRGRARRIRNAMIASATAGIQATAVPAVPQVMPRREVVDEPEPLGRFARVAFVIVTISAFMTAAGGWSAISQHVRLGKIALWPGVTADIDIAVLLPLIGLSSAVAAMTVWLHAIRRRKHRIAGWALGIYALAVLGLGAQGNVLFSGPAADDASVPTWLLATIIAMPVLALKVAVATMYVLPHIAGKKSQRPPRAPRVQARGMIIAVVWNVFVVAVFTYFLWRPVHQDGGLTYGALAMPLGINAAVWVSVLRAWRKGSPKLLLEVERLGKRMSVLFGIGSGLIMAWHATDNGATDVLGILVGSTLMGISAAGGLLLVAWSCGSAAHDLELGQRQDRDVELHMPSVKPRPRDPLPRGGMLRIIIAAVVMLMSALMLVVLSIRPAAEAGGASALVPVLFLLFNVAIAVEIRRAWQARSPRLLRWAQKGCMKFAAVSAFFGGFFMVGSAATTEVMSIVALALSGVLVCGGGLFIVGSACGDIAKDLEEEQAQRSDGEVGAGTVLSQPS